MYLGDMIRCCENVNEFTKGLTRDEIELDVMRYDAILRNIEILGEAAGKIPADVRIEADDVPWSDISAIRNILAHAYFGVDKDIIWNVVNQEIPQLLRQLRVLDQHFPHEKI